MERFFKKKKNTSVRSRSFLHIDIYNCIENSTNLYCNAGEYIVICNLCNKEDIIKKFGDLTEYEYACNEMYWSGKAINYQYKKSVNVIMNTMLQALAEKYKNKTFVIYVFMENGLTGWIQTRFHVYRDGEFPIDTQIQKYKYPVLYCVFET